MSSNKGKTASSDTPIEVKEAGTKGGNGQEIDKAEYDAVVAERDQLKINLYLMASNLKDVGFQISDNANAIQRLGNDITQKIRLTPEQVQLMQQGLQQQQQQQQQQPRTQ